jgi:hypothetical protein
MTAIAYDFVRASTTVSDFWAVACFSLAGIVLSLALICLGLDVGAGIPG